MEQGLASTLVQNNTQPTSTQKYTVDEVAKMLIDGKDPEELLSMGISEELIIAAIDLLEKELGQEDAQAAPAAARPDSVLTPGLAQSLSAEV